MTNKKRYKERHIESNNDRRWKIKRYIQKTTGEDINIKKNMKRLEET